jgi:hypothetical protein
MTTGTRILLLGLTTITVACSNTAVENQASVPADTLQGAIYENEYGRIELIQVNDSLMRTIFSDNEKVVFDTLMKISYDNGNFEPYSLPFLALRGCGLKQYENRLHAFDFLGMAQMPMYTGIPEISENSFYRVNIPVTISDEITREKAGILIDGIYLAEGSEYVNEFVHLTGTIKKEKYPHSYYSTPDSPQGMFNDTTIAHYRLVVHDYTIEPVEKTIYKGTAMTIDGQRAVIWEFADSEAYYLADERPFESWPEEVEGKEVQVKAVLVQEPGQQSVLKAWEILD